MLSTLQRESINIRKLTIDSTSNTLISYLSSFSGLSELTLTLAGVDSPADSDRLAEDYYRAVIPRHAVSLTKLSIHATYEGHWCFGTRNASRLAQCVNNLQSIELPHIFGTTEQSAKVHEITDCISP